MPFRTALKNSLGYALPFCVTDRSLAQIGRSPEEDAPDFGKAEPFRTASGGAEEKSEVENTED